MIVQFVQFETSLTEEETIAVAEARLAAYRDIPGLVQKYYLKLSKPNHYGGLMIWETKEDMLAFRESDLGKTIASSYKVIAAPDVDIHELMFPLRDTVAYDATTEAA